MVHRPSSGVVGLQGDFRSRSASEYTTVDHLLAKRMHESGFWDEEQPHIVGKVAVL